MNSSIYSILPHRVFYCIWDLRKLWKKFRILEKWNYFTFFWQKSAFWGILPCKGFIIIRNWKELKFLVMEFLLGKIFFLEIFLEFFFWNLFFVFFLIFLDFFWNFVEFCFEIFFVNVFENFSFWNFLGEFFQNLVIKNLTKIHDLPVFVTKVMVT